MQKVAVVLAGGWGQRFGTDVPKQLLTLAGKTLIEHCIAAFEDAAGVDEILLVMTAGRATHVERLADGIRYPKVSGIIEGGATRTESTRLAIGALGERECDVLFHDAARPLLDQRIIADCVTALGTHRAVGVAVPTSDTIVVVDDGVMTRMPSRENLLRCQTPQGFRLSVIRRAHRLAMADPDFSATDDCGVVLRYLPDVPVRVVPGSERNIKITYPGDLRVAESFLTPG